MNGLSSAQHRAIFAARKALAESLQQQAPPDQLLPLVIMATTIGFVDIVRAAAGAAEIVAFVNSELAAAGLALVPLRNRENDNIFGEAIRRC